VGGPPPPGIALTRSTGALHATTRARARTRVGRSARAVRDSLAAVRPVTRVATIDRESSAMGSKAPVEGSSPRAPEAAEGLIDYLNASWTAFHAVEEGKKMLLADGYVEISERDSWCVGCV
jgi:hypothetical protein